MGLDLPDDMLWYLTKHFLNDKDCIIVIIAGVGERFTKLFRVRKRLDIGHLYWLQPVPLCDIITQMSNLEELSIQDTQISLRHLPRIFEACKKIVKFSFTLGDTNLEQFKKDTLEKVDLMKQGFGRLTHLKIFMFTVTVPSHIVGYYYDSWLVLLEILGWCKNCVELLMQFYCTINFDAQKPIPIQEAFEISRENLLPHLSWMKNLRSLILVGDGEEHFLYEFLDWLIEERKGSSNALERLWYTDSDIKTEMPEIVELYGPHVKSLVFQEYDESELKEERYQQLEHVAGIKIRPFHHLPNLKYISGQCRINDRELNEFCKTHPKLEELHLDTLDPLSEHLGGVIEKDVEIECFGDGNWKLLSLKVLVYKCVKLSQRIIEHLVVACPNINELHVEVDGLAETCVNIDFSQFFSAVQFQHLTRLTITGQTLRDGSYLPSIIEKCPKLERLHLRQCCRGEMSNFVFHLFECLPKAVKLRDLRLEWAHDCNEDVSYIQMLFESLLKCSSHLERLLLADNYDDWYKDEEEEKECSCSSNHNLHLQSEYLVSFVSKMKRLVAFCLAGARIDAGFADLVKQELTDKILPLRPALYFYVGKELIDDEEKHIIAPRIYYDEMIYPINPFDALPEALPPF